MKTALTIKPRASLHAGMLHHAFNPGVPQRRGSLSFVSDATALPDDSAQRPLPEVLRQVERLALALQASSPTTPHDGGTLVQRRIGVTLRLDPVRHARLRATACAQSRSAQKLLAEALDRYFAEITETTAGVAPSAQPGPTPFHPSMPCTASTGNQP